MHNTLGIGNMYTCAMCEVAVSSVEWRGCSLIIRNPRSSIGKFTLFTESLIKFISQLVLGLIYDRSSVLA